MKIEEVSNIIWELNCEAYEYFEEDCLFSLKSGGNTILVNFLGVNIWNSDDDMRGYIDEDNQEEKEPLDQYLTKEASRIINKLDFINKFVFN